MDSVRMDKWLWAARFFKTRSLAAQSCDMGRVMSNDHEAKPARDVRVGDVLRVKNEGGEFVVEVLALSAVRGPARSNYSSNSRRRTRRFPRKICHGSRSSRYAARL